MSQAGLARGISGGGGTGVLTITGNSGGAVPADGSNNINIVGGGAISVTGSIPTNTLTITSSFPFFMWSVISGGQPAVNQTGYFVDGVDRVDLSLPAISSVGDTFAVADLGGNKWRLVQAAGQQIIFGNLSTTAGGSGYLESIFVGDVVWLVCCVADLQWMVVSGNGNLTVV